MSQTYTWWIAQAELVARSYSKCPKCGSSAVSGRYSPASQGKGRVVEAFCRICGWSKPELVQFGTSAVGRPWGAERFTEPGGRPRGGNHVGRQPFVKPEPTTAATGASE